MQACGHTQLVWCVVQAGKRGQEDGVVLATQFSEVVHMLLLVVPMHSILAVSETVMADVDEEEEEAQPEASTSGVSGKSVVVFAGATLKHSTPHVHAYLSVACIATLSRKYTIQC